MKHILIISFIVLTSCVSVICYFYVDLEQDDVRNIKVQFSATILGAVNNPGDYLMEKNSKIINLINKAGGLLPNASLDGLDLKEVLKPDFTYNVMFEVERIEKINLNAISNGNKITSIVKTFKISSTIANALINYKLAYGNFNSWEEVDNIKGVGEKTLVELKKYFYLV